MVVHVAALPVYQAQLGVQQGQFKDIQRPVHTELNSAL